MGETVIEKIIRNNVGHTVKPGDIVTVNVDRVMIHDIFIPFVAEKFEEMGFKKLWTPDKVVLIYDHLVPASQLDDTRHFHVGDAFAEKYGMKNVHRSDGICHQLMTEAGYVKPGNIVFGTDSHTTTYGLSLIHIYGIEQIIIAIPSAGSRKLRPILDICKDTDCELKILPGMDQLVNGEVNVSKLRPVNIEDLSLIHI